MDETKRLINDYYYYRIIVNEEIIGCFLLHDVDKDTMELEDLCIHPDHQGRGYGYKALLSMEDFFPVKKKWILRTPFYNIRSQHLIEKAGYVKTCERVENMVFVYEKVKP